MLVAGASHPHGFGRQRLNRKQRAQPSSLMFLQKQLSEAKSDLLAFQEKQARDDSQRDTALEQQRDRNLRLENIIEACVELISSRGGLPSSLRRMIEYDAPGALASTREPQSVPQDVIPGRVTASSEPASFTQSSTTLHSNTVPVTNHGVQSHSMAPNGVLDFSTNMFSGWPPEPCFTADFFLNELGNEQNIPWKSSTVQ